MKKLTTRWYYTLKEVLEAYNEEKELGWTFYPDGIQDSEGHPLTFGDVLMSLRQYLTGSVDDDDFSELLFSFYLWPEFQDEVVVYLDTLVDPWQVWNEDSDDELEPDFEELEEKFAPISTRMWRWLIESTSRYGTLIRAYNNIKSDLLAKVQTISESEGELNQQGQTSNSTDGRNNTTTTVEGNTNESGSNSQNVVVEASKHRGGTNTKVDLYNDTPQTGGDFTTDPYVTNARKITDGIDETDSDDSETTTEGLDNRVIENNNTTTFEGSDSSTNNSLSSISNASTASTVVGTDVTTPIERLDEVRKKLHNLYADWADEFKQFVIYAD